MDVVVVIGKYTIGRMKSNLFFLTVGIEKQKIILKTAVVIMRNPVILIADNIKGEAASTHLINTAGW